MKSRSIAKNSFKAGSLFAVIIVISFTIDIVAQTTAFKYQGSLSDNGSTANGSFQMQFKLYDAVSAGSQIGSTLTDLPVTATSGVFSVSLDFGTSALNGANRWIEIAVRRNSGESYVTLSPREQISSAPYAVRTLSALQADTALDSQKLGGVDANQFVQTNDARLSDARNPLPGNSSYIQNSAALQASSNFNISGAGTATALNVNGPFSFGNVAAPPIAPAGQGRFYFDTATNKLRISENGGAYVNLVGATGVSGSGTVNRISFWSAGTTLGDSNLFQSGTNIGIGTATPGSGFELRGTGLGTQQRITDITSGNSLVLQAGSAGNMKITGYNYGTALAQPLYLSTDGANTILNPNGGNVAIGTTPDPSYRLDASGPIRALSTTAGHFVAQTTGGTNSWARYYMRTPNRSWFMGTSQNFNGDQFYIVDETVGQTRLAIASDGSVGFGTTPDPFFRLDAAGPIRAQSTTAGHFVAQTTGGTNSWARFYMRSPSQSWFIGTSQGFGGNQLYIGDETNNQTRFTIQPNGGPIYHEGSVTQNLGGYGLPKALLFVLANGTIVRCYNGVTGSTTGGCGFTVSILQADGPKYRVDIGVDATNRFAFVTSHGWTISQQSMISGRITSMSAGGVNIYFFENDADILTVASDFFLLVY